MKGLLCRVGRGGVVWEKGKGLVGVWLGDRQVGGFVFEWRAEGGRVRCEG